MKTDYSLFKPYAAEGQLRYIEAWEANGKNISKAAKALGLNERTITNAFAKVKAKAALKGFSPEHGMTHTVPDGFKLKGTSTLYDEEGNKKLEWVKSQADSKRQEEIVRETVQAFVDEIKPCKPTKKPKTKIDDLLTSYCIGDAHIGMYAWGEETGEDFDCDIASRELTLAAERLVETSPQTKECLVVQLGDFYHADDSSDLTPGHKNRLDTDSRFLKVIRTGINVMRTVIGNALKKHEIVRVRNVAGNHDPHAYITLNEALIGYYHKEPRVIIEASPKPLYIQKFGSSLIGITHGHAPKPDKLPGLLAVNGSQDWGSCDYKYIWHGHIHNKRVFEEMGCLVESFRTLAAKDIWTVEQGYMSGREMQSIIIHKDYGEIERHTVGVKMVK